MPDEFYTLFEKKLKKGNYPISKELLRASYIEDLRTMDTKFSKEDLIMGRMILFKMVDVMLDELDEGYKKTKKGTTIAESTRLANHLRVKRHHKSGFVKKYSDMFESIQNICKKLGLI
jgi:hypothetical protein